MRILELFAGYGSQALALENLGVEFTSDISEIDKYAIQAYNQLHGNTHNWGDICKIDETQLPYYDLITYSSPCQDFSVAGLGKGGDAGSGTRSSLLWECERIIRAVKPKYLLMENVKNLVGEKHKHNFVKWLKVLESLGYQNFWKVLNAKDYGVPQNRERVFVVSVLGGGQYLFPSPVPLEIRLKDILEPIVNEKYYINCDNLVEKLKDKQFLNAIRCGGGGSTDLKHTWDIVCVAGRENGQELELNTLEPNILTPRRTDYGKQIRKDYENGTIKESRHNMTELVPRNDGVSNTLTSVQKDNYLMVPSIMEEPYNLYPNSGNPQAGRVYNPDGISPAMDTCTGGNRMPKITESFRIRKLTPRECWRLMGVRDEQFDKLHDISNSQLYKLAGNSIVVDVLMGIFKNLLISDEESKGQLTLL